MPYYKVTITQLSRSSISRRLCKRGARIRMYRQLFQTLSKGLFVGAVALSLTGCLSSQAAPAPTEADPLFSSALLLRAYEGPDGTCEIRYPSGETAAILEAEDAFRGFPGRSASAGESEGAVSGIPTYFGQALDGTLYAVTCSGPSAGSSSCNVLLSQDGGTTWTLTGSRPVPLSMATGAGFQTEQVGFLCSRYFQDSGPEIYLTRDGGESWSRLELERPEEYRDYSMTPGTPILTQRSVCFPIQAYGPDGERPLYCSSTDLEHWIWTEG